MRFAIGKSKQESKMNASSSMNVQKQNNNTTNNLQPVQPTRERKLTGITLKTTRIKSGFPFHHQWSDWLDAVLHL